MTNGTLTLSLSALVAKEPSDALLLGAYVRDRDSLSFAMIVRRHGPMVLGVCRRMIPDHHLAEDAFQAVFVVLARNAAKVRPAEKLPHWLYGVAYRVARRGRAMASRQASRERNGDSLPESTTFDRESDDLSALLDDAIAELPDGLRDAVVLCELDSLSRKEAARRLTIPEGTLSSRLAAARKKLADSLRSRGVVLPAGALVGTVSLSTPLVNAAMQGIDSASLLSPTVQSFVHGVTSMALIQKWKLSTATLVMATTMIVGGIALATPAPIEPMVKNRTSYLAPIPQDSTWNRFKAICGSSEEESKKLFEAMLGDEKEAKELRDADSSDLKAFKAYSSVAKELTQKWDEVFREYAGMLSPANNEESPLKKRSESVVTKRHVLRQLFLGARELPEGQADWESIPVFLECTTFIQLMNESESARKLYASWLKQRTDPKAFNIGLEAALFAKIPEVLPFVRERITDQKVDGKALGNYLLILGNRGEDRDLATVLSFRNDLSVFQDSTIHNPGRDRKEVIQIQDIAVVMAFKLKKEDPEKYDFRFINTFAWWVSGDPAPFGSFYYYFADETKKKAAHEKAKPWLEEQVKAAKVK